MPRGTPYRKRKFPTKKRKRSQRIPRSIDTNNITVMLRSGSGNLIENATGSDTSNGWNYALQLCTDYAKYTALFDQYRIDKIRVTFTPVMTQIMTKEYSDTLSGNIATIIPEFVTAIDYDDASAADFLSVLSKNNSVRCLATEKQVRTFRPKRLIEVYQTALNSAYKVDQSNDYLDCTYVAVPHYGMKTCLQAASPVRGFVYEVTVDYYVSFINRRH